MAPALLPEQLVSDLRGLGVVPGDVVMVHASLRAIGPVAGGAGGVIAALDADPHKSDRSGQVLIGAELGHELGVVDIDGQVPASRRPMLGSPPGFHPAVVR